MVAYVHLFAIFLAKACFMPTLPYLMLSPMTLHMFFPIFTWPVRQLLLPNLAQPETLFFLAAIRQRVAKGVNSREKQYLK